MIEQLLFWVFALLVCGGAIAVVVSNNVVHMAFWLVMSLGSVAALFFLLHADFLGAAQLLIYVGGTVVLLVFGVMLTASGPYVKVKTSPAESLIGATVGLALFFVLMHSIGKVDWLDVSGRLPILPVAPIEVDGKLAQRAKDDELNSGKAGPTAALAQRQQSGRTVRKLGLGFLGLRPDRNLGEVGSHALAPGYLLPFEIVSIHLLVVLIGAAYLARAKRRPAANELHEMH